MTGRPSRLTPELTEAICGHIREGSPQRAAAGAEGVSESTLHYWKQRGADGDEPYRGFLEALTRAWNEGTVTMVRRLAWPEGTDEEGKPDAKMVSAVSQNLRWLLERTRREDFGQQVDIRAKSEAVDHVLEWLREGLDPDTYARVMAVLAGGESSAEVAGDDEQRAH